MLSRFKENWVERVTAVLITLLLLLYVENVTAIPHKTRAFSVPIHYDGELYNAQVRNREKTIVVYATGPADKIDNMQEAEIYAFVNVQGQGLGLKTLPVRFKQTPALNLITLKPAIVDEMVDISQQTTRQLTVQVTKVGINPLGFQSAEPTISPKVAKVSGWKDVVDRIGSLRAVINLDELQGNIDTTLQLTAYDIDGRPIPASEVKIEPFEVRVKIELNPLPRSKTVEVVVPLQGSVPSGVTLEQASWTPRQVTLTGEPAKLATINEISTEPITLEKYLTTRDTLVKLIVPAGVRVAGNPSIRVRIEVKNNNVSP